MNMLNKTIWGKIEGRVMLTQRILTALKRWRIVKLQKQVLVAIGIVIVAGGVTIAGPATVPSDRLTFLTLHLSNTEASINAINLALRQIGFRSSAVAETADSYNKANLHMDRNGGGPVPWDEFYGKTASSFYAPTSQTQSRVSVHGGRVADGRAESTSQSGLHPIDRPAAFDYLYKANAEQQASAQQQVADLAQKSDVLLARRRELESEQSSIWATIAFESIENREIPYQPLVRYRLRSDTSRTTQPASDTQRHLLESTIIFLTKIEQATANAVGNHDPNQQAVLDALRQRVSRADASLKQAAFDDVATMEASGVDLQRAKDLLSVAKQADDVSNNIADAYRLAADGDAAGDESRKQTFRGQLQTSLLQFASVTAVLNQSIEDLAAHWVIHPMVGSPSTRPAEDAGSGSTALIPDVDKPKATPAPPKTEDTLPASSPQASSPQAASPRSATPQAATPNNDVAEVAELFNRGWFAMAASVANQRLAAQSDTDRSKMEEYGERAANAYSESVLQQGNPGLAIHPAVQLPAADHRQG